MKKTKQKLLVYIMTLLVLLCLTVPAFAGGSSSKEEGRAVSIALDISGSMKGTDSERFSIELIKMFIDLCGEKDYFNVTAYNDQIAYTSGMVSMADEAKKEDLKKTLDLIEFTGDTDNGLGLYTATKALADMETPCADAFVMLISDGNTDLENSSSERTAADSNEDMNESSRLAREHNIAINAVEYTGTYSQDTSLLSVVTAATGGSTTLVDEPMQFAQVMLSTFFSQYNGGKADFELIETPDLLNRQPFTFQNTETSEKCALLFSSRPIQDFEITGAREDVYYTLGDRYAVIGTDSGSQVDITAIYSFKEPSIVLAGMVEIKQEELPEDTEEETPQSVEVTAAPVGTDTGQEVYASKEKLQIDVSKMFSDADMDIVSYRVADFKGFEQKPELSGSMLGLDITEKGTFSCNIQAIDTYGNKGEAVLKVTVIPEWKRYYGWIVAGIILLILAAAVISCWLIVKKLLFHEKKELPGICGILEARFIDIKSKNESVDIKWNLEDYPPEGVSLDELFKSRQILEALKDLDKICFYPGKVRNEILFVHCMEGGVFVGEQLIRANMPVRLRDGDVIYLSFAENASEIELRYEKAGS